MDVSFHCDGSGRCVFIFGLFHSFSCLLVFNDGELMNSLLRGKQK